MEIAFLIGAGFSIPEGYPKTEDINVRLGKIHENEICVHTDGACWFLKKGDTPRYHTGEDTERLFIQDFLRFYNKEILKKSFNYEKFFDFYTDLIREKSSAETATKFNTFIETFNREKDYTIFGNRLVNFDNCFNQLLADFFRKVKEENFEDSILSKLCKEKYSFFLELLKFLDNKYKKIHFHSLNHDLLIEKLSYCAVMKANLSNGFTQNGSPYWKENDLGQSIQLNIFVNNFDRKFCLYKLHGSLNQYFIDYPENNMVRVEKGTYLGKLKLKLRDKNDYKYIDNYYSPDFLSGIKVKKRNYERKIYYKPIFKRFKENLEKSNKLIVIGYGLGDDGINNYIEEYFLSKKDSKMLVIDPHKINSPLYNNPNVIYYGEGLGIEDINNDRISRLLGLN